MSTVVDDCPGCDRPATYPPPEMEDFNGAWTVRGVFTVQSDDLWHGSCWDAQNFPNDGIGNVRERK